ncbi:helix-turn-helix domain-containing protein [Paenibacillus assamensis]|uniref:helix-turn-helix domain-containing protein n=1 Tax=Paenibacillus assamensis TaxID=311244 RepID=UPI000414D729|nr:helix-turn-helix domain-containing protein [Paenibacillus assamensis]
MKVSLFSLADMIRHYRLKNNLTQHDVAIKTNMTTGAISKIENGKTKPEFQNMRAIASVLEIPYNKYIKIYIDLEKNSDTICDIFNECITLHDDTSTLIPKIVTKYLELSSDTYDAVEQIYNVATSMNIQIPSATKLSIYKTIIDYSRSHGIMLFLARALYQEYLIERNDSSKLKETYQAGRYILKYIEKLSPEEFISLIYALAVHAYALQKYEDVIHFCKLIINNEYAIDISDKRIFALGMLRDSYYYCDNIKLAEEYFHQLKKHSSTDESDGDKLFIAVINYKKGNVDLAKKQFKECLNECAEDFVPYVTNEYISFLLQIGEISKVEEILPELEHKINDLTLSNPLEKRELAWFYKLKGDYYSRINDVNKALNNYIDSAFEYSQIDDINNERNCLKLMYDLYRNNKIMVDAKTTEKVKKVKGRK